MNGELIDQSGESSPNGSPKGRGRLYRDFLASIVVFLVALPLCMGVAIASGAPVAAGLITGIIGGIVVGLFTGCPLQVSGPAAGLTVIIFDIIGRFGLEWLGLIVLLAGLMQIAAGALKLGQWFRAVSPAVIQGMLAGIGILILASQFHVMVDESAKGKGLSNVLGMWSSLKKAMVVPQFESQATRATRIDLLRRLGELHRQQIDHRERIAEWIPHAELDVQVAPAGDPPPPSAIQLLSERQRSILEGFEALAPLIVEAGAANGHDGQPSPLTSSVEETRQAMLQGLRSIESWDSERVLPAQATIITCLEQQVAAQKNHGFAAMIGLSTIALILLWKLVAPKKLSVIPPPLLAIVIVTVAAYLWVLPVIYVEVPDKIWNEIRFPSWTLIQSANWGDVLQQAVFVAIVASAETLLCCTAVDQMHNGPRTRYDQELVAQGIGNSCCGLLGALPMTGVIVRSSANVQAGATTRLSSMLHGLWLLIFVVFLAFLLRMIPTASLAAILVYTGFKLVNFKAIAELRRYGWSEVVIYVVTVLTIVSTDLLTGVLTGLALAAAKLLYVFSHLETGLNVDHGKSRSFLQLRGAATFVRLPKLAACLERVPASSELHVDFEHLDYIDHACLELLMTWARQHQTTGGRLVIDWNSLHARFRGTRVDAAEFNNPTAA